MVSIYEAVSYLSQIVSNQYLTVGILSGAMVFKVGILLGCIAYYFKPKAPKSLLLFLIIFLGGLVANDLTNLLQYIFRQVYALEGDIANFTLYCRICWALYITQCQAIAIFFEYLMHKKVTWNRYMLIFHGIANAALSLTFIGHALINYGVPASDSSTLWFEMNLIQAIQFFVIAFVFIPLFYRLLRSSRVQIPAIVRHHIRVLTSFLIPFICFEMLNNSGGLPLAWIIPTWWYHYYLYLSITVLLSSAAIYIVIRKMLGLRFLNIKEVVQSKQTFNFLTQFRDILEQLNTVTSLKDLAQLTQTFFQTAFTIPLGRVRLYVRNSSQEEQHPDLAHITAQVERYIGDEGTTLIDAARSHAIFIRDDIHFSAFYQEDAQSKQIHAFLDAINADIFIPVFERREISAYIIVERNARPDKLFTGKDRDEMLVFTTYVSNMINMLNSSNLQVLHHKNKKLTEEVYQKHQEINQYKESLRSFLRSHNDRQVGILFYKNRRFTIANEAAQKLIGIDPNTHQGHQLTQAMRNLARKVQEYKLAQTAFAQDAQGKKIIINGFPSLENRSTILVLHYPEASDIIRKNINQLKDPSTWDYLLYLETTKSGQLVNQLIPGTSEQLLQFKINLLSTALSKQATLLELPEDDLMATVQIIHDISLRQTLHTLHLTEHEKNNDVAIKLFGLNPLLARDTEPALLERLDSTGTVFIKNIDYLSLETQELLAEYIALGYFHSIKSDHKIFSNARIICSTSQNLAQLVQDGAFSAKLYTELEKASITMPPLHQLTQTEVSALAQGYAEQLISEDTYKNLLDLTDKDTAQLYQEQPLSLHELKELVHQLLVQKSTKHNLSEVTTFDPAYNVADPDIAHAVRLGKKALKDPRLMTLLWNKFSNQSKIAQLLGVNRSSVNRRCREYNLT